MTRQHAGCTTYYGVGGCDRMQSGNYYAKVLILVYGTTAQTTAIETELYGALYGELDSEVSAV